MAEPKDPLLLCDTKPMIGSHTPTEFGIYDAEPFPVKHNAYGWYIRAVYWKREANRKEGVQHTMEFTDKSEQKNGKITLSATDLAIVQGYLKPSGEYYSHKIDAIKHVRTVTMCGLKEAKDYVETLENNGLEPIYK